MESSSVFVKDIEKMPNLLSKNKFTVKVECNAEGVDNKRFEYFTFNTSAVEFSRSAVKITCVENEDAQGKEVIDVLYEHSLVPPSLSQITGKMMPPKGNATISLTMYDKEAKKAIFTDVADGLFLANHKYAVTVAENDSLKYELIFMHPSAIASGPMFG